MSRSKLSMITSFKWFPLCAFLVLSSIVVFAQNEIKLADKHYKTGLKHYRAGRTEYAIEDLYTALSVRELFPEAQILLGRTLVETKRYKEAVATLKGVEKPHRNSVEVQKLLGKAYY